MLHFGYAEADQSSLPSVNNDPARAEQPLEEPVLNIEKQENSIAVPEAGKTGKFTPRGTAIQLKKIVFAGNTIYSASELEELVADYLLRPIDSAELESIRLKVSQYYADHGYINSGAVVEAQSVADGILRIKIIEGRLTEVRQIGQGRLRDSYIADRLLDGGGVPLSIDKLQETYHRLLSDPLIQHLNARLLPGGHPGEALLDVQVTRNRPYQLYAGVDDYSTSAVGAYTGRIGGWVDNLLTMGERIDGNVIINGGGTGYNTGISMPLNARDTRVTFRYSDTQTTLVEAPLAKLKIATHVVGIDTGVSQPVYRDRNDELNLGLNFLVRQSQTLQDNNCYSEATFTGIADDPSCRSQVTVLRMSQRAKHRGEEHSATFSSTFSVGLDVLGATTLQKGGQSGQFFSWLGQSVFSQKLLENNTQMVLKGNIQLSDSPLLPIERFSVGGVNTVRGYRENTLIRDNGFNTSLELKYPLYGGKGGPSLFLVPFADYGGAWYNTSALTRDVSNKTNYLVSTGIGFNWHYEQITTDFYWAHAYNAYPVQSQNRDIQDDGIHFRINCTAF